LFEATAQRGKALNDPEIFLQTPPPIHTDHEIYNSPATSSSEFTAGRAHQRSIPNVANSPHLISVSDLFEHPIIELQLPVSTDLQTPTVSTVQASRAGQTIHILPSTVSTQPPQLLRRTLQAHLLHRPIQTQILQAIIHTPQFFQHPTETFSPSILPAKLMPASANFTEQLGETFTRTIITSKSEELTTSLNPADSNSQIQNCKVNLTRLEDNVYHVPIRSSVKRWFHKYSVPVKA
jgi:hypothetical protein